MRECVRLREWTRECVKRREHPLTNHLLAAAMQHQLQQQAAAQAQAQAAAASHHNGGVDGVEATMQRVQFEMLARAHGKPRPLPSASQSPSPIAAAATASSSAPSVNGMPDAATLQQMLAARQMHEMMAMANMIPSQQAHQMNMQHHSEMMRRLQQESFRHQ